MVEGPDNRAFFPEDLLRADEFVRDKRKRFGAWKIFEWLNFCRKIWYKVAFQEEANEIVERTHSRWYRFCIDVDRDGDDNPRTGILVNAVIELRDRVPRARVRVFESSPFLSIEAGIHSRCICIGNGRWALCF
jgi:hypothetical protein